uniref:Ras-related protein Rab-2B n=1 Tax=Macrostomum lignano TaxID=282301 RepID=A0A1I8IZN8_9PLAT
MLVGDSGTGKTSFMHQFKDAKFPGSTFHQHGRGRLQGLGHGRYGAISEHHHTAILLFYDLTSRQTFSSVRSWLTEIREYGSEDVFIILVANKADLDSERQVSAHEGQRLAQECDIMCFMETSARTGHNVDLCFQTIGRKLLAKQNFQTSGSIAQADSRHQSGHRPASCSYC